MSGQAHQPPARGSLGTGKHTNGRLLTADELADRWRVPKAHVYRLTRGGHLPTVKLGRYYRYSVAAVEEFEAGGGVAADA